MRDFSDHEVWQLLLSVGMRGLEAAFFNRNTREFVPYMRRSWECPDADVLKNVENAVYDDPLLPNDYDTTIMLRPRATLLVPPDAVDEEDTQAMREALDIVDAAQQKDVWSEPLGNTIALYSTPRGVKDFLSRTFLSEKVHHISQPMVTQFSPQAVAEGGEKMWVHLGEQVMDIVAFRDGTLTHAGFWYCNAGADAVYFILCAWKALGFDCNQGELRLSGKEDYRRVAVTALRKHIKYVSLTTGSSALSEALSKGITLSGALALLKAK